jgi:hypothetical protein
MIFSCPVRSLHAVSWFDDVSSNQPFLATCLCTGKNGWAVDDYPEDVVTLALVEANPARQSVE